MVLEIREHGEIENAIKALTALRVRILSLTSAARKMYRNSDKRVGQGTCSSHTLQFVKGIYRNRKSIHNFYKTII